MDISYLMIMERQRQVANRIRIGDLIKGNAVFDGERFSSLDFNGKKISRINLIANVVDRYSNPEKNYNSLTIDDGTGQIRIKGFSDSSVLLANIEIGDTIKVIGWLRYFSDELYILPEIAARIDPKWGYVRKLELLKEYGEFKEIEVKKDSQNSDSMNFEETNEEVIKEKLEDETIVQESAKSVVLKKIKESQEGIDVEKLIMEVKYSVDEINDSISGLIADGEIYEPKPGTLRSLD